MLPSPPSVRVPVRPGLSALALVAGLLGVPALAYAAGSGSGPRIGLVGSNKACRTAVRELLDEDAKVVERDKVPGRPASTEPDALERWINASVRPGSVDLVLVVDVADKGSLRVLAFKDGRMVGLRLVDTGKGCTLGGRVAALTRAWLHSRLSGAPGPTPTPAPAVVASGPSGRGGEPGDPVDEGRPRGPSTPPSFVTPRPLPGSAASPGAPSAATGAGTAGSAAREPPDPSEPKDPTEPRDPDDDDARPRPSAAAAPRPVATEPPPEPEPLPPRSLWPVPRGLDAPTDDPTRPRRPGADADLPTPRPSSTTAPHAEPLGPSTAWLRARFSVDLVSHTFQWVEPLTPNTRELRFDLMPTPHLAAELEPLRGVGPSWLAPTTVLAGYRRTFGLTAHRTEGGPDHTLTFADFELGLAYPLHFDVSGRALTVRPHLSLRDVRVVLDPADGAADEIDLPDVTYTGLSPGAALDLQLQGRVHLTAHAAYQLVLGVSGPLDALPTASRHGFSLGAGVAFELDRHLVLGFGLDWLRYALRFEDAPTARQRARGADGETLSVSAAIIYRVE